MKSRTKVEEEFAYQPERMKRLPRGSFRERHPDYDPATAEKKVRVTMYLDADVLEYFRGRAAQPNAAPYQTQINNELRRVMEGGQSKTKMELREALAALTEIVEEHVG
jgi:uncharacterized protein (DUF4415 family)